jgi:uncharacterized caspase-like protein
MSVALTVGINQYNIAPLRGCVNDSNNMKAELENHNFHVYQLLDEQATKENIINKLTEIANAALPNDHIIFHYSGHGSQIPCSDVNEADGLTEILCPFDLIEVDGSWTNNFITDDELSAIFNSLDGVTVECLLDCCHSGSGTRDLKPNVRYRHVQSKFTKPADVLINVKPFSIKTNNIICWSGCQDDETSADCFLDGSFQGAFTNAFLKSTGFRVARFESIKAYLKANGLSQNPVLTCSDPLLASLVY